MQISRIYFQKHDSGWNMYTLVKQQAHHSIWAPDILY